jgi:hypothetical protein
MAREIKRWTREEDEALLRQVRAFPQNLNRCFLIVSEITGRTPGAVANHWYTKLSKNPETPFTFGVIAPRYATKNRKNGEGTPHSESIFRRIVRLLGF